MTPVFLVLVLFSLIPAGVTEDVSDISDTFAKFNTKMEKRLVYDDIMPNYDRNADPCTARGCLWPKSGSYVRVPVSISSQYSRNEQNVIIRSLVSFYAPTCIRFVWRNPRHRQFIHFFPGTGCWSSLGRQRRGQAISLQRNGCVYKNTVQHEVLHALGFHHEQVRSDRDQHVTILTQNIQSGKESNFRKVNTNNLNTPYDFTSVMHYSNYAFSRNGQPTIIAKQNPNMKFGRAPQMSAQDIARINKLYRCCESKIIC